jgi:hypothetical protein
VRGSKDHYNSVGQIFGELLRDAKHSEHVDQPRPPQIIKSFGAVSPQILRDRHYRLVNGVSEAVQVKGGSTYARGLRTDAKTLYTEIHSHPMSVAEFDKADKPTRDGIRNWAALAIKNFKARMPEGIAFCAAFHFDETYVHFHINALNTADPKLNANKLHAGKIAAAKWREENGISETIASLPRPNLTPLPLKPKKPNPSKNRDTQKKNDAKLKAALTEWGRNCDTVSATNETLLAQWEKENSRHLQDARKKRVVPVGDKAAFDAAMVTFQDRYFEAVGKPSGLLRHGPKAERLSTQTYAARKREATLQAEERRSATATTKGIAEREESLTNKTEEAEHRSQAVAKMEALVRAREEAVVAGQNALIDHEKARAQELERKHQALHKAQLFADQEIRARAAALQEQEWALKSRERQVSAREQEVGEAVTALGDIMNQMENGEVRVKGGSLRGARWPKFIRKIMETTKLQRSPVQGLVIQFIQLLSRGAEMMGGERSPEPGEDHDRPGF